MSCNAALRTPSLQNMTNTCYSTVVIKMTCDAIHNTDYHVVRNNKSHTILVCTHMLVHTPHGSPNP